MISPTGLIVPSTLEIDAKATSFVRSLSSVSSASNCSSPSSLRGMCRSTAPRAGKLLPGDEIRVVLHLGEQDLVARLDVRIAPTSRTVLMPEVAP